MGKVSLQKIKLKSWQQAAAPGRSGLKITDPLHNGFKFLISLSHRWDKKNSPEKQGYFLNLFAKHGHSPMVLTNNDHFYNTVLFLSLQSFLPKSINLLPPPCVCDKITIVFLKNWTLFLSHRWDFVCDISSSSDFTCLFLNFYLKNPLTLANNDHLYEFLDFSLFLICIERIHYDRTL